MHGYRDKLGAFRYFMVLITKPAPYVVRLMSVAPKVPNILCVDLFSFSELH